MGSQSRIEWSDFQFHTKLISPLPPPPLFFYFLKTLIDTYSLAKTKVHKIVLYLGISNCLLILVNFIIST